MSNSSLKKIVSGGQTGADQGGLFAAHALGIPTGGYAPKNWMTEIGPNRELMQFFGLTETNILGYEHRTELNVYYSTGTVLFGDMASGGSKLTSGFIQRHKRPNCHFDIPMRMDAAAKYLREWIEKNRIEVLNVAGNRESRNKGIQEAVTDFLTSALG